MSTYAHAVKVRLDRKARYYSRWLWSWKCQGCEVWAGWWQTRQGAHDDATRHAATCQPLHWANWQAARRSCALYGRIAPACPVCLGYGTLPERTAS